MTAEALAQQAVDRAAQMNAGALAAPEPDAAAAAAVEPAAAPGCQICFEAYGSVRPSLKLQPPSQAL